MSRVAKPLRGQRPNKRLDLTDLRRALKDRRTWAGMGVVMEPPEGGPHYELVVEDGGAVDILVEVTMAPYPHVITARLASSGGGHGAGVYSIPNVGDEVAVVFGMGSLNLPMIVGVLPSRNVPNPEGQGPALNRTIIVNSEVFIHDGAGGAEPLVLKSDVQAVVDKFNNHAHQGTTGPTGAPIEVPGSPPGGGTALSAPDPVGTTVLKAK